MPENEFKPFEKWAREKGIDLTPDSPPSSYTGAWFQKNRLPMVVHCTGCEMTMPLFSAYIDQAGYTWCESCGPGPAEVEG